MRLIKTTLSTPLSAPTVKRRRSPKMIGLSIWLGTVTVMLGIVIYLLAHLLHIISSVVNGI